MPLPDPAGAFLLTWFCYKFLTGLLLSIIISVFL